MAVIVLCPNLTCRKVLSVPDETRGQKVRCKYCGTTFRVPVLRRVQQKAAENAERAAAETE